MAFWMVGKTVRPSLPGLAGGAEGSTRTWTSCAWAASERTKSARDRRVSMRVRVAAGVWAGQVVDGRAGRFVRHEKRSCREPAFRRSFQAVTFRTDVAL